MKRFDCLKTWMVPTLLFSMMTFMSCGHQQSRKSDDLFSGMDQPQDSSVADSTKSADDNQVAEVEAKSPELTQADAAPEVAKDAGTSTDDKSKLEAQSDAKLATPMEADSKSTDSLAIPKEGEQAKLDLSTQENTSGAEAPVASIDTKSEETVVADNTKKEAAVPELMPSTSTGPAPQLADAPSTLSIPSASDLATDAQSAASDAKPEATVEAKAETKVSKPVSANKTVVVPQIPKEVVWQGNQTMNRYYFLRTGDTGESVSQLIYGNNQHSADLKKWNSGKWTPGRMIVFVSNNSPEDAEMKSVFDDKGVAADSYVVKSGDWLSKIAMNTYGDAGSWKEIAAINGIESPDTISAGQTLKLYPAKVAPATEKVAMIEPAPAPTVAANTTVAQVDRKPLEMDEDDGAIAPAPMPANKAPQAKAKASAKLASPEIGGFVAQNITWIIAGALAMMIFFLLSRRFRKSGENEEL